VKETTRTALLFAVIAVVGVISYQYFLRPFIEQEPQVQQVLTENSTWSVTLQEYILSGPIAAQTYRLSNDNGRTTMFYAATNRAGTETKEFTVPLVGPEGTFLFEQLRADGIWDVDEKAVRPDPKLECIMEVDQTLGDDGGTRSFSFSDPRFWATTTAKEYDLKLPPKGAIGDSALSAVGSGGKDLRDPRYLEMVQAIEAFGPSTVVDAESKIRAELAATALHPIPPR